MFADLHRHVEGSITPFVAAKIGRPIDCHWRPGKDFFESWAPIFKYIDQPERYGEIVYFALEELALRSVKYVEFQFSPAETAFRAQDIVRFLSEGIEAARRDFSIRAGLIYCLTRHRPGTIDGESQTAIEFFEAGKICGVGLAGDEKGFPIRSLRHALTRMTKHRIPKSFHAGEFTGALEILDAIDLGASRIGHGNHLLESPLALAQLRAKRVGLEVCLTSEIALGNVRSLPQHPVFAFLKHGLLFNLNTDDPAVFGTEIDQEYELVRNFIDPRLIYRNAIEMSFAPPTLKEQLLAFAN